MAASSSATPAIPGTPRPTPTAARARPGWSYQLVAEAAGVTIGAVKQAVRRGRLDMDDLGSVIDWASARRQRRRVKEATRR